MVRHFEVAVILVTAVVGCSRDNRGAGAKSLAGMAGDMFQKLSCSAIGKSCMRTNGVSSEPENGDGDCIDAITTA
jgi:hypothetical protein